ncbi:MAG: glycosyltransferase family 9 protein, partial [Verrucomicrobiales bacterium]
TWPVENFRELIRSLLAENDAELLLLSPPAGPDSAARALAAEFPELHHEPDSAIATLLPLLASCERIIANDGTLPHLAAHLGTPPLTLFGPNEPAWKRPLGTIHQSLREHVPCSPCFLPKCPLDHRCLQAITPAQVLAALSPTAS